jgi:hypothetical protein
MVAWVVEAAEHGGKEHAGQEHGGAVPAQEHGGEAAISGQAEPSRRLGSQPVKVEPSAEQLRDLIRSYVKTHSTNKGTFEIRDDVIGATRQLKFVRVHERVGKTGTSYYSCADMKDTKTGELLDLDFDVVAKDGTLDVVDARIHKVKGKPRYTYNERDQRVPVR